MTTVDPPKTVPQTFKRRADRANVGSRIPGVFIRCPDLSTADIRVLNISELGAGIRTAGVRQISLDKRIFDGKLIVGMTIAALKMRALYVTPEMIGFEFLDPPDFVRGAIRFIFRPELTGAAMNLLAPTSPEAAVLEPLRYRDARGNTLQIERKDQMVRRFTLQYFGLTVDWSEAEPIAVVRGDRRDPVSFFILKQMLKVVHNIPALEPEFRNQMEAALRLLPWEEGMVFQR